MRNFSKFILGLISSIFLFTTVFAASIDTNKNLYNPGETVLISGIGFPSEVIVSTMVKNPNGDPVFVNDTMADENGNYMTEYIIPENAVHGTYTVWVNAFGLEFPVQTTFNFITSSKRFTTTTTVPISKTEFPSPIFLIIVLILAVVVIIIVLIKKFSTKSI